MNNIDQLNKIAAHSDAISEALQNAKKYQSPQLNLRNFFERTVKNMCDTVYQIEKLHTTFIAKEEMKFLSNTLCKSRKEVDAWLKPPHVRYNSGLSFEGWWKHNNNLRFIYETGVLLLSPLVLHKLTNEEDSDHIFLRQPNGRIAEILSYERFRHTSDSHVYEYMPRGETSRIWGMHRRPDTKFNVWYWMQMVLYYPYKDKNGVDCFITANRQEIVHFVRNVLGGTHTDVKLTQKYRQNLQHFIDNCEFSYDILLYSVIAISYEMQFSFDRFIQDKCSPK